MATISIQSFLLHLIGHMSNTTYIYTFLINSMNKRKLVIIDTKNSSADTQHVAYKGLIIELFQEKWLRG